MATGAELILMAVGAESILMAVGAESILMAVGAVSGRVWNSGADPTVHSVEGGLVARRILDGSDQ